MEQHDSIEDIRPIDKLQLDGWTSLTFAEANDAIRAIHSAAPGNDGLVFEGVDVVDGYRVYKLRIGFLGSAPYVVRDKGFTFYKSTGERVGTSTVIDVWKNGNAVIIETASPSFYRLRKNPGF